MQILYAVFIGGWTVTVSDYWSIAVSTRIYSDGVVADIISGSLIRITAPSFKNRYGRN
jgi:hypothetical protein